MWADAQPDPALVGAWLEVLFFILAGIASLVGIILGIKKLATRPPLDSEPATRAELNSISNALPTLATKTELKDLSTRQETMHLENALKADIARLETQVRELEEQTRERFHFMSNKLEPISNRLVWLVLVVGMIAEKSEVKLPKLDADGK